jgi:hypothetical protein
VFSLRSLYGRERSMNISPWDRSARRIPATSQGRHCLCLEWLSGGGPCRTKPFGNLPCAPARCPREREGKGPSRFSSNRLCKATSIAALPTDAEQRHSRGCGRTASPGPVQICVTEFSIGWAIAGPASRVQRIFQASLNFRQRPGELLQPNNGALVDSKVVRPCTDI